MIIRFRKNRGLTLLGSSSERVNIIYMNCGTAKHMSVDCTIMLLHFGVVEHSVKLVWVSFSNNAKPITLVVV